METIIQQTLKRLLDAYGADYTIVSVVEKNGHYTANIETDTPAVLIGKNGSVISALQILLKSMLFNSAGEKAFVTVDVDGYREAQHQKLYDRVTGYINMMQEQNLGEIKLRPMRPGTRRLVHLWIAETHPELTSDSVGEGMDRAVRIFYK